jgi:adenine-specific DNA-methyltransferase
LPVSLPPLNPPAIRLDESSILLPYEWYALQRWGANYWQEFEQPKIIVPAITDSVNYAPDERHYFSNDKTSILIPMSVFYVLGLLNSSVSQWIAKQEYASKQGGFYEFKPMYVSKFPIPTAAPSQQAELEKLVRRIVKTRGDDGDVTAMEAEVNERVYRLYGLTREEIAVVEETK